MSTQFEYKVSEKTLTELDITRKEFDFYWDTFVKYGKKYWVRKRYDENWYQVKRNGIDIPLTQNAVLNHLKGNYWIGKQMPGKTGFFVIDLDFDIDTSLNKRFNMVTEVFPNPLIIQSSASKGLHLYYFLENEEYTDRLSMALQNKLIKRNIKPEGGKIEIFPGNCGSLRLPFGKDSTIIDPDTFHTVGYTLEESFTIVNNHPKIKIETKPVKRYHTVSPFKNVSNQEINYILNNPIPKFGMRYKLQSQLVYHFLYVMRLPSTEVYQRIIKWYQIHDHISKDWINRPDFVKSQLRSSIRNLQNKIVIYKCNWDVELSFDDIEFIIKFTKNNDEKYGHYSYKLQRFVYSIFKFFKFYNKNELIIPFNTFVQFDGASIHTVKKLKQYCIDKELIILEKEHIVDVQGARYHLNYNYSDSNPVKSFEEGLMMLYSKSRIFKMYKRGTYEHIMEKVKVINNNSNNSNTV